MAQSTVRAMGPHAGRSSEVFRCGAVERGGGHAPLPGLLGACYSTVWNLRNQEIEPETLIFAPISLSYIEID